MRAYRDHPGAECRLELPHVASPRPMSSMSARFNGCGATESRPGNTGVFPFILADTTRGRPKAGGRAPLLGRLFQPRPAPAIRAQVAPRKRGANRRPLKSGAPVAPRLPRLSGAVSPAAKSGARFSERPRSPFVGVAASNVLEPSPRRSSRRPLSSGTGFWSLEGALPDTAWPIRHLARNLLGQRPRSRDASANLPAHTVGSRSRILARPARH